MATIVFDTFVLSESFTDEHPALKVTVYRHNVRNIGLGSIKFTFKRFREFELSDCLLAFFAGRPQNGSLGGGPVR